jgi:tetratricopeptide (TPR) repeat protein
MFKTFFNELLTRIPYYKKMRKKLKIFSMVVLIFLASCGTQELVRDVPEEKKPETYPTQGLMHFMYGEIYRVEGNMTYANLEYRRALEYDTTATILKAIGESYRLLGKHKLATDYYEKALRLAPEDESVQYNVVDLYMKEMRFEEVIPMLENYLQKEPENADYLQRLAESYRRIGDYDKSLSTLDKLMALVPQYPWSYIYAAEIMLEQDRIADAAPYLEKVARKIPPNAQLYEFWVRSLFESNNIDGMLSALEFWLDQNPDILAPYLLYVDYKFQMNDFESGNRVLNRVKNRLSEDGRIPYFLGVSAMHRGDVDSVLYYFDLAERSGDIGMELYSDFALWFWGTGDLAHAENIADRAIGQFGPSARWLHMKAMINAQKGNWPAAETLLLQIVSADSGNVNAKEDLANIYVETGQADQVIKWYDDLLSDYPQNPSILNNYAYALARLDIKLDLAMDMVNKALKSEKSAAYTDTKAWILYRQKKYKKALNWIKRSLTAGDAGAEVHYHQGMILLRLNRENDAKRSFQNALQIDLEHAESIKALEELK